MEIESYYYSCSRQYIDPISPSLHNDLHEIISNLPERNTQSELNQDLFWLITSQGRAYDSVQANLYLHKELPTDAPNLDQLKKSNDLDLCLTTTTLDAGWRSDFVKLFTSGVVQVETHFGKVEADTGFGSSGPFRQRHVS